jgi:hypothetical protein
MGETGGRKKRVHSRRTARRDRYRLFRAHRGDTMRREALDAIVQSGYAVPDGIHIMDAISQLLPLLGAVEPHVRESSLEILWQWAKTGQIPDQQLIQIGWFAADGLMTGLGEASTDTVFLRSFSALMLGAIACVDQRFGLGLVGTRSAFLDGDVVRQWFDLTLGCLQGEKDLRGYVTGTGWAHALGHLADALCHFARSPHLDRSHLERLLMAIADKLISPSDAILCFDEDDRLARTVVHALLRDQLDQTFLQQWIQRLVHTPQGETWDSVFGLEHCDSDRSLRDRIRNVDICQHSGCSKPRRRTDTSQLRTARLLRPAPLKKVTQEDQTATRSGSRSVTTAPVVRTGFVWSDLLELSGGPRPKSLS